MVIFTVQINRIKMPHRIKMDSACLKSSTQNAWKMLALLKITVNFQYIFKQTESVCKCNLLMKNHLAVLLRMSCLNTVEGF